MTTRRAFPRPIGLPYFKALKSVPVAWVFVEESGVRIDNIGPFDATEAKRLRDWLNKCPS